MFSNLLSELDSTLKEAKKSMRVVRDNLPPSALIETPSHHEPNFFDPTSKSTPAPSFPKSTRFKELEKEELTTSYVYQVSKVVEENKGVPFGRSQRFKKEQTTDHQTILYPKDTLVKKSNKGVVINPSRAKDLNKSTVSVSTAASVAEFGPGMYIPVNEITKTPSFSKGSRFTNQKPQYTDQTPLYPNVGLTKKRPPSAAVMKKQTLKNDKQLMKQREQLLRQRLRLVKWRQIPFEIDRYFKNSIGPILKKEYFSIQTLEGRPKAAAIMFLLQKINYLRAGFQQNIATDLEVPCTVAYRKSAPKPFKFPEYSPAPDEYYPVDDMVKPKAPAFSFGKFDINKILTPEDPRDYDLSEDILKNVQNIIISPEHKHIALNEQQLAALQRGPGFYDAVFSLVENRTDIGQVKYVPITEKNDRVNNLGEKRQVNDADYTPEYTAVDKNIGVPLYKEPANVKPQHLPEAVLFPEHWVFYDGDLNKVRAEIAKNVLMAKGLNFQQYQVYANNMKQFKAYLKRQQKQPQHGQYEVTFKGVDKDEPGFEMEKMQEKGLIDPIVKEEGDVNGDNLILRPEKPKPNVPSFDFGKMVGREEPDPSDQPNSGDVLILNPRLPENKLPNIDFKKMIGREQNNDVPEDGPDGDRLIIHPTEPQKHIPGFDFKKHQGRQQISGPSQDTQEVVINKNYTLVEPRTKGFVDMQRMSEVRLVAHLKKLKQDQKSEGHEQ